MARPEKWEDLLPEYKQGPVVANIRIGPIKTNGKALQIVGGFVDKITDAGLVLEEEYGGMAVYGVLDAAEQAEAILSAQKDWDKWKDWYEVVAAGGMQPDEYHIRSGVVKFCRIEDLDIPWETST